MVSINTNISALVSQANLTKSDKATQSAISKLSSGNRIIRAADDAAGLAVGTGLRTDVSTLRTALTNTSQANSVLALADGALQNIGEIMQRQKALASQANSGSLSDTERFFLNQEFQNLTSEIDRIATTTNFNGIKLIDGSIFDGAKGVSDTSTESSTLVGTITIAANTDFANGETIVLNGFTITAMDTVTDATTQFARGANIAALQANLVTFLQNSTDDRLTAATYSAFSSNVLTITSKGSGANALSFEMSEAATGVVGTINTVGTLKSLNAGATASTGVGLSQGNYTVSGEMLDSILVTSSQTKATNTATLVANDVDAASTVTIGGSGGDVFTIRDISTTPTVGTNELFIDLTALTTLTERAGGLVAALNASNHASLTNFTFSSSGAVITATYNSASASASAYGQTIAFDNVTLTPGSGAAAGIDLSRLTNNEDFIGTISGFQATYSSADKVTVSVEIGDYTYTAAISDTTPSSDTYIRFIANDPAGGRFDLQLESASGQTVNNQTDADTLASRLDRALSGLTISQRRNITSYEGIGNVVSGNNDITGVLNGSRAYLTGSDFSDVTFEDIKIEAPATGATNGLIEVTINGGTYRSSATVGSSVLVGGVLTLTNTVDPNKKLEIEFGGTEASDVGGGVVASFSTTERATALQEALKAAFGIGEGAAALDFQVGIQSSDTIKVGLESATTADLFGGTVLDVSTKEGAIAASDVLDEAINAVTALRASIGSLQSRFDFAAANLETTIQNTDAARGDFLDADVAKTSTDFAKSQVLLQASISVLAQANQLPQNLLKLIG